MQALQIKTLKSGLLIGVVTVFLKLVELFRSQKDPFRAIRRKLKEKEGNYRAPTAKMSQAKSALVIFNLSGVFSTFGDFSDKTAKTKN